MNWGEAVKEYWEKLGEGERPFRVWFDMMLEKGLTGYVWDIQRSSDIYVEVIRLPSLQSVHDFFKIYFVGWHEMYHAMRQTFAITFEDHRGPLAASYPTGHISIRYYREPYWVAKETSPAGHGTLILITNTFVPPLELIDPDVWGYIDIGADL